VTKPKFTCFKCGGTDLGVIVLTQAKLLQEPDGNIQTEAVGGNHEWGCVPHHVVQRMRCLRRGRCIRHPGMIFWGRLQWSLTAGNRV